MSMDRCVKCSDITDTDMDCQFYDFAYLMDDRGGHCEHCRYDITKNMNDAEIAAHERRTYG